MEVEQRPMSTTPNEGGSGYIAFVPGIAPLVRTGPTLIRGLIAILHGTGDVIEHENATDPMHQVDGRARVKISTDKADETRVLKVVDAIKCIEDFLNGDVIRDVLIAILKGQIFHSVGPINNAFDLFAATLTTCIRNKALGQDSSRTLRPKIRSRRNGAW
jgi:hypothetical protein